MTEESQNIITTIKQMEASLDDEKDHGYDLNTTGLRVTFPLNECLRSLKEQYNTVSRLHRERFEQVKKLVQALESYSSHLESSFVKISAASDLLQLMSSQLRFITILCRHPRR